MTLLEILLRVLIIVVGLMLQVAIVWGFVLLCKLLPRKRVIEVCQRMQVGKYHAQFAGHPEMWSQGSSVADAVESLIQTHCRGGEPVVLPHDQDIEIKQLPQIR